MFPTIWHHLSVCPCLPKLQEETWGWVESWHGSWFLILMTLSQKILVDAPSNVTPSQGLSGWPCPPRLQEETWSVGGVLTWFLMTDLDETFTETSDECSLPSDTISRTIRNIYLLIDFRKRLGKQEKSWNGSWCQILMKQNFYQNHKSNSWVKLFHN